MKATIVILATVFVVFLAGCDVSETVSPIVAQSASQPKVLDKVLEYRGTVEFFDLYDRKESAEIFIDATYRFEQRSLGKPDQTLPVPSPQTFYLTIRAEGEARFEIGAGSGTTSLSKEALAPIVWKFAGESSDMVHTGGEDGVILEKTYKLEGVAAAHSLRVQFGVRNLELFVASISVYRD